jgi:uncharacterized protein
MLMLSALLMGILGGPHCIAMCGAACAGLTQQQSHANVFSFHLGRVIAYALLGALVATSAAGLAWLTSKTSALHPVWTFFHVFILVWGLHLLLSARQPSWIDNLAKYLWQWARGVRKYYGGMFVTGLLWAFMPCGLLYSALLLASLNASPVTGALAMAGFALGSSISLILAPTFWRSLKQGRWGLNEARSMRLAGLLLSVSALFAIWHDLLHLTQVFCR